MMRLCQLLALPALASAQTACAATTGTTAIPDGIGVFGGAATFAALCATGETVSATASCAATPCVAADTTACCVAAVTTTAAATTAAPANNSSNKSSDARAPAALFAAVATMGVAAVTC